MAPAALAAQEPGARGQMMAGSMYDKATEATVTATVTEVRPMAMAGGRGMGGGAMAGDEATRGRAMGEAEGARGRGRMSGMAMNGPGIHLLVTIDGSPAEVHLGPQSFLTQQKYTFAPGDQITVTGARTRQGDTDTILARVIRKGDATMTFRDESGRPLWAGRGRATAPE
jgi:hypothetical protein